VAKNIPTFSIPRPSKMYANGDYWNANIPSANPELKYRTISDGSFF
jgi:hypothetical protein